MFIYYVWHGNLYTDIFNQLHVCQIKRSYIIIINHAYCKVIILLLLLTHPIQYLVEIIKASPYKYSSSGPSETYQLNTMVIYIQYTCVTLYYYNNCYYYEIDLISGKQNIYIVKLLNGYSYLIKDIVSDTNSKYRTPPVYSNVCLQINFSVERCDETLSIVYVYIL